MSKRYIKLYLKDIQEVIRKIEKYTHNTSFSKFAKDEQMMEAVIKNLNLLASLGISPGYGVHTQFHSSEMSEIFSLASLGISPGYGVHTQFHSSEMSEIFSLASLGISPG